MDRSWDRRPANSGRPLLSRNGQLHGRIQEQVCRDAKPIGEDGVHARQPIRHHAQTAALAAEVLDRRGGTDRLSRASGIRKCHGATGTGLSPARLARSPIAACACPIHIRGGGRRVIGRIAQRKRVVSIAGCSRKPVLDSSQRSIPCASDTGCSDWLIRDGRCPPDQVVATREVVPRARTLPQWPVTRRAETATQDLGGPGEEDCAS